MRFLGRAESKNVAGKQHPGQNNSREDQFGLCFRNRIVLFSRFHGKPPLKMSEAARPSANLREPNPGPFELLMQVVRSEKKQCYQDEKGKKNCPGICHVAKEGRHFETGLLGDGFYHEIGTIPDIGQGTH